MIRKLSTLFFAVVTLMPGLAAAAVPQTVGFSARIADNGRPVTGSHDFVFRVWDCDGTDPVTCVDPGNVKWTETQTLDVQDGVVSTVLGADSIFPGGLFSSWPALWLSVTMDGTTFGPFMAVNSVPYALRASTAEAGDMGLERIQGTPVTIDSTIGTCPNYANGTCYFANASASCSAGKRLLGGGCFVGGTILLSNIMGSYPSSITSWGCFANSSQPSASLTAYAICARMQ